MDFDDSYIGREPAKVKHFLLGRYLEALAYKILQAYDALTFVDAFSGPWQTQSDEFKDSSFGIALGILTQVQAVLRRNGRRANVKCVFVEKDPKSFSKLAEVVGPFHRPEKGFSVEAIHGDFEQCVGTIERISGRSFQLLFIDPKGWKGYAYGRTGDLIAHAPGEVIVNFMYDHFNRFKNLADPRQEELRNGLLGDGWSDKLDLLLATGQEQSNDSAITRLFRERLREVGGFTYVVTTRIDKATKDRPQYFLVYATRHAKGLEVYRDHEAKALKLQVNTRSLAKSRAIEERQRIPDLFAGSVRGQSHEDFVRDETEKAKNHTLNELRLAREGLVYRGLWTNVLERFVLTKAAVNRIIRELEKEGKIEKTWRRHGPRVSTPRDDDLILLK